MLYCSMVGQTCLSCYKLEALSLSHSLSLSLSLSLPPSLSLCDQQICEQFWLCEFVSLSAQTDLSII